MKGPFEAGHRRVDALVREARALEILRAEAFAILCKLLIPEDVEDTMMAMLRGWCGTFEDLRSAAEALVHG